MRGAWAGELGQTQFMPSSWMKYAVDFDGNGKRDLLHNAPDVLASTANYLAGYGWQRGKDWQPGAPNFAVLQQWNKSEVYAKTVAYFASQLATRALKPAHRMKGPIAPRPAPAPSCIPRSVRHVACIALLRCMPQAPILPLSIASCAAAMCFCAADLASPSAMASTMDFGLVRFAPLQPPTLAACAGTTAKATAAIAATPSNFFIMLFSILLFETDPASLPESARHDLFRSSESGRNEFRARNVIRRAPQSPHANDRVLITGL